MLFLNMVCLTVETAFTFVEKLLLVSPLLNNEDLIMEVLLLKERVKDVEQKHEIRRPVSVER
jgi:hypothetical protein